MSTVGQGPILPFEFSGVGNDVQIATNQDLIDSALLMIYNIQPGQRPMQKDFGSTLPTLLFSNFNTTLGTVAGQMANEALQFYEDRIEVDAINIIYDPKKPDMFIIQVKGKQLVNGQAFTTNITVGGPSLF